MKKQMQIAVMVAVMVGAALVSGCATGMTERRTALEWQRRGYTINERNPDMLQLDITPEKRLALAKQGVTIDDPLKTSKNEAAWISHPIQMALDWAWDYVVLPVAGTGAAVYGGSKLMSAGGGGNSQSTNYTANNGGQINVNHGPGQANQAGPSTTSTSSTTGAGQ
jgi:hypothetical protein